MKPLPAAHEPATGCGDCQACCYTTTVKSKRPWIRKRRWKRCRFQCDDGCAIYQARPRPCAVYTCAWLKGEVPARANLRPDVSGLVVEVFAIDSPAVFGRVHCAIATEVWAGALEEPAGEQVLAELRAMGRVILAQPHKQPDGRSVIHDPGGVWEAVSEWIRVHGLRIHDEAQERV